MFTKTQMLVIALIALVVVFLAHNGVLNLIMPGQKTQSRRSAKRHAKYIAEVSQTAAQNMANSTPPSLTSPVPLPVIDTWGGEAEAA